MRLADDVYELSDMPFLEVCVTIMFTGLCRNVMSLDCWNCNGLCKKGYRDRFVEE